MRYLRKEFGKYFPAIMVAFFAFFLFGCGDSKENVVTYNDYPEICDEDDECDVEDDMSSESKTKKSSSSKKQSASSSSKKVSSSSSKNVSSSSSEKEGKSSSGKVKSSSSKKNPFVASKHFGEETVIDYSTEVSLPNTEDEHWKISTDFEAGTGSVTYFEDGSYYLECEPENYECKVESFIEIVDERTIDEITPSGKSSLKVEYEISAMGTDDNSSVGVNILFESEKGDNQYEVHIVHPIFPESNIIVSGMIIDSTRKPNYTYVVSGDTFSVYEVTTQIQTFTGPIDKTDIYVVSNTPVDSGKVKTDVTKHLEKIEEKTKSGFNPDVSNKTQGGDNVKSVSVSTDVKSGKKDKLQEKTDTTKVDISKISINVDNTEDPFVPKEIGDSKYSEDEDVNHSGKKKTAKSDTLIDNSETPYYFEFSLPEGSEADYYEEGSFKLKCSDGASTECYVSSMKKFESEDSYKVNGGKIIDIHAVGLDEDDWTVSAEGIMSSLKLTGDVIEFSITPCNKKFDGTGFKSEKINVEGFNYIVYYKSTVAHFELTRSTTIHSIFSFNEGSCGFFNNNFHYKTNVSSHIDAWRSVFGIPQLPIKKLGTKVLYGSKGTSNDVELEYFIE